MNNRRRSAEPAATDAGAAQPGAPQLSRPDRSQDAIGPDTAATTAEIGQRGIVAVIRAPDPEGALACADALAAGGVRAIEVAFTTPDAPNALRHAQARHPDILVGAGTVMNAADAQAAIDAGASFVMSPHTSLDVLEVCRHADILAIPGVATPTEVARASQHAPILKLFPATGGPGLLSALRGPFPDLRLLPAGGVTVGNLRDWMAAGAYAVSVGTALCPTEAIARRDFVEIQRRAALFVSAMAATRQPAV